MLSDSDFARLQMHLLAQPEAGDVIPGSDGCRKLRWALAGRGRRGGARFLQLCAGEIVLVTMYAKNVRDNIDAKLLRELRRHYEKNRNS